MDSGTDSENNFYIITSSNSSDNIATSGAYSSSIKGSKDTYVSKFNKDGQVKWSTYIGGTGIETGQSLTLSNNKLFICGATSSKDNIASSGAYQAVLSGSQNSFIIELNLNGEYQKGTYYGGDRVEEATGLGVDENGNIYISGYTTSRSQNLSSPTAFQKSNSGGVWDIFLAKFNNNLEREWGTYFGGSKNDVASDMFVDTNGDCYITGYIQEGSPLASSSVHQSGFGGGACDAFILVFDTDGKKKMGTYFGGNDLDWAYGINLDSEKNIYLAGFANSSSNIATNGAYQEKHSGGEDCFAAKFTNSGNLLWSTYLGSPGNDRFLDISIDKDDNPWFSGHLSGQIEMSDDAIKKDFSGTYDIIVSSFSKIGEMKWLSYLGGVNGESGRKLNCTPDGVYISGATNSLGGIATKGSHQEAYGGGEYDNYIVKLGENSIIPQNPCENSSFNFKNFKSIIGLNLLNDAVRYDSVIRLTKADYFQKGIVWSKVPFDISKGFKSDFTFELSEGNNFGLEDGSLQGADGIVFLISGNPVNKVGYAGGGIAFEGLSNAIAIELDLYKNEDVNYSDPNGNHIAMFASKKELSSDHNSDNLIKQNTEIEEIKIDKTRYQISIDYEAKDGTFNVFLNKHNSSKKIALEFINFDIESYIDLIQGNSAYFGIAAATGNSVQRHELFSWNLCAGDLISSVESNYNEILAFPNPNNGFITIVNLDCFKSIEIVDILGNSIDYKINSNIIDISDKNAGTYFLKLVDLSNKTTIQKIIKY